ncbi:MAG: fumarate reductase subunit D [Rubrivivax sp.]|nr:fumarate reductase subunit D [Rubrivivax sp.]
MNAGPPRRRSHAPVFWLLFGGGGLLAALFGTALVFITGFAAPLDWPVGRLLGDFARVQAFAGQPIVRLVLWGIVSLFAWHAVHRILHSLHDVGVHGGRATAWACYGAAGVVTLVAGGALLGL